MAYSVNDRRGKDKEKPLEACRVCGAPKVHTREYNKPTMDCIKYLREQIQVAKQGTIVQG